MTDIAVLSLADGSGQTDHLYMILEKAGNAVIVTLYDITSNTFYTGTDSADSALVVPNTPELEQLLARTAAAGTLAQLQFVDADGTARGPQQIQAGWPPAAEQLQQTQAPGTPAPQPAARLLPALGTTNPNNPPPPVPGPVVNGQVIPLPVYGAPRPGIDYPIPPNGMPPPTTTSPPVVVVPPTTAPFPGTAPTNPPGPFHPGRYYPGVVTQTPNYLLPGPLGQFLRGNGFGTSGGGTGIGGGIIWTPPPVRRVR